MLDESITLWDREFQIWIADGKKGKLVEINSSDWCYRNLLEWPLVLWILRLGVRKLSAFISI